MKRLLLLSLGLLLLCFPLIGCDSEEGLAVEQIASIVEGVGASEADTCTFDIDFHANVAVNANGQSMAASIDGWGEGYIDNENEDMYIPITITVDVPGLVDETISLEMYIVDGWMYTNMNGEWTKMEVPQEMLGEQDQNMLIGQMAELMTLVEIDHTRNETLKDSNDNDVDCYVFQIKPDMAQLAEYAFQEFQQPEMDDIQLDDLEEILSSFDVDCKFWIAEDNNLLMKINLNVDAELSTEDLQGIGDVDFGDMNMNMSMDMSLEIVFDYNQDVNIHLPDEAKAAYVQGTFEL